MTTSNSLLNDRLPLSEYPGTPQLVRDALAGRATLDYGFPLAATDEGWTSAVKHERSVDRPRREIAETLLAQNQPFDPPQAVLDSIEALADPETLTVVTGQQVGLGGGPLLTLYKAMTAIATAERMEERTGIRTVPVFWMATSDHNLVEAAQVHWIDTSNTLSSYKHTPPANKIPVGMLPLGDHAEGLLARLLPELPETEFSDTFTGMLTDAYRPERTFAEAFRALGLALLGRFGMVFLDPEDPALKRLTQPFLSAAVAEVDERLDRLIERNRQIQHAGYKVQAPVEAGRPALFVLDEGQRRKVVLEGKSIRGHSDIILSRDELARIAREEPETLSTGVTLRPLLQGWLLPTAAYVAGPHEMAYWAELAGSFGPLGLNSPAILPRASLTLIEPKVRRWLDKHGVQPLDLYGDVDALATRLMPRSHDDELDGVFGDLDRALDGFEQRFRELTTDGEYAGLKQSVDSTFRKVHYHADKLRHAFSERSKRKHGDLLKHLDQLATHINPGGSPQERVISPFYYLVRFGGGFLDGLHAIAADAVGQHGFVDLKELSS